MYNVIRGQAQPEENKRQVIDSNERMNQIMEAKRKELERLAEERRKEQIQAYLDSLEVDEEGKPIVPEDEEGNYLLPADEEGQPLLYLHTDGFLYEEEEVIEEPPEEPEEEEAPEPVVEEPPINREEILAEIQKESDAIIAKANADAEEILANAKAEVEQINEQANAAMQEAETLKAQAAEEGRQAGHEEGYQAGYDEGGAKAKEEYDAKAAAIEAELSAKTAAYESETARLKAEYTAKENDFEQQMADVFCDIIDKVFHIEFSDKKEIILHLVDNVLTNTPGSKEYLVRVNDHNYDVVNENKEQLIEKVGSGIGIDIIKDPLLGDEECQIETDGGVYDCGMDIQLANLLKDLKALSLV